MIMTMMMKACNAKNNNEEKNKSYDKGDKYSK
jgi:hypothetical protein